MGLAIVSWKQKGSGAVRKEEILTTTKWYVCFISHWMHDLLGNLCHYSVNMRNWGFNEVKWPDQAASKLPNPSSESKHNNGLNEVLKNLFREKLPYTTEVILTTYLTRNLDYDEAQPGQSKFSGAEISATPHLTVTHPTLGKHYKSKLPWVAGSTFAHPRKAVGLQRQGESDLEGGDCLGHNGSSRPWWASVCRRCSSQVTQPPKAKSVLPPTCALFPELWFPQGNLSHGGCVNDFTVWLRSGGLQAGTSNQYSLRR